MTIQELYESIGGNYEQATRIMRMDKLIDRHIRKFPNSAIPDQLKAAGESMDAQGLYEGAHALKGICANLGLDTLAGLASDVTEEFRPGNPRTMSDDEVKAKLAQIDQMFQDISAGIRAYEAS